MKTIPFLLALAAFPVASDAATCGFVNWYSQTTNTVRLKIASDPIGVAHTTSDLVAYKSVTYFTCPENPTASLYMWAEDSTGSSTAAKTVKVTLGAITCDGTNLITYRAGTSLPWSSPKLSFPDSTTGVTLMTGVTVFFLNYGTTINTPLTLGVKKPGASSFTALQGLTMNYGSGMTITCTDCYGTSEFRFKDSHGTVLATGTYTGSANENGMGVYVALIGTFDSSRNAVTKEAVVIRGCSSSACNTCDSGGDSDSTVLIVIVVVVIVVLLAVGAGAFYYFYHKKETDDSEAPPCTEGTVVAIEQPCPAQCPVGVQNAQPQQAYVAPAPQVYHKKETDDSEAPPCTEGTVVAIEQPYPAQCPVGVQNAQPQQAHVAPAPQVHIQMQPEGTVGPVVRLTGTVESN